MKYVIDFHVSRGRLSAVVRSARIVVYGIYCRSRGELLHQMKGVARMEEIKLHDSVALLSDLPEHDLKRGDVGTVVEVFEQTPHHPAGYIVEFVDDLSGAVYATTDLTDASRLMVLHFRREAA